MGTLALLGRSLRHRDYRLFFFGQLLSLHGTWMQNLAQAWLVYRLSHSSFMLGLVGFLTLFPVLVLGFYGGAVADRVDRRRLFLLAQTLAMLQATVLALLTLTGQVQLWHILLLAGLLGFVHAFEIPARHAMVAALVPREDLPNAVALNSSLFNLARFLGPVTAGWVVDWTSEGVAFAINAVSFVAVILSLLAMRGQGTPLPDAPRRGGVLDGLRFAWRRPHLRRALVLIGLASLLAAPYVVLLPVVADQVFGGGAGRLGYLVGAAGFGAFLGALNLARQEGDEALGQRIGVAGVVAGGGLLGFAMADQLFEGVLMLVAVGFGVTSLVAATNTYLQLAAPDRLRGRVMSLFSVIFIGMMPLGNLLVGALAEVIGVGYSLAIMGGGTTLAALRFLGQVVRERQAQD